MQQRGLPRAYDWITPVRVTSTRWPFAENTPAPTPAEAETDLVVDDRRLQPCGSWLAIATVALLATRGSIVLFVDRPASPGCDSL
jgi:hypothetical protein